MPFYPVGEGHHRGRGPVVEAYVDTDALEIRCPNPRCMAQIGDFCRHEAGQQRKMPCPVRIQAAAHREQS